MIELCPACGRPMFVRVGGVCGRCASEPTEPESGGAHAGPGDDASYMGAPLGLTRQDPDGLPPLPPLPHAEPPGGDQAARPGPADIASRYTPVDWETAWKNQPGDVAWLLEPILEEGTINALFARVDTGKSLLALEWSLRLVREGRTVVYIDEENRLTDVVTRLTAFSAEPGELARLLLYSFAGLPPLDTTMGGVHLLALAEAASASLVILDTTTRMVQGGENDSDTFLQLYRCALVPLKSRGITVLRLDHPGKNEERGQRGSSAKDGDCDTIWRLTEVTKGQKYRLRREKNRSGHAPDSGDLEVDRRYAPVRHVWAIPDRDLEIGIVGQLCEQLDRLKIPPSAGRDRCRAALNEAGIPISNARLSDVVRQRRFAPDSSPDSRTADPVSDHLSPPPPHTKWVEEGQVAHPSADGPGEWPPGSIGEETSQQPPTEPRHDRPVRD